MTKKSKYNEILNILIYLIPAIFFISFFLIYLINDNFRVHALWDSDINWLLKTGEYIYVNNFNLPSGDIYSFTHAGKQWVLYQWLFEVITYLTYSIGNYQGLGYFATLLFTIMFTLLFCLLRRHNVNLVYIIIAIIFGSRAASVTWYMRPSSITYLLVCLVLLIFNLAETKNNKYLWCLPVIFLFWCNLHLGFTFGIILLLVFLVYKFIVNLFYKTEKNLQFLKLLAINTLLSLVATLINPYGYKLYLYMLNLMNSPNMNSNINELQTPDFHSNLYLPVLIIIGLFIILSMFQKKQHYFYTICLAITTCMTLGFVRNLPFLAIFATIFIALQLQNWHEQILINKLPKALKTPFNYLQKIQDYENNLQKESSIKDKASLSYIVIFAFILLLIPLHNSEFCRKYLSFSMDYINKRPYDAYNFILNSNIPGKFYTNSTWGSYAIHKLYPKYKVFIDTRFDMYGDKFFYKAHKIEFTRGDWQKQLDKYEINWLIVPDDSLIAKKITRSNSKKWFTAYKDKVATIFIRNLPQNKAWFKNLKQKKKDISN